jgi:hypothetical protein
MSLRKVGLLLVKLGEALTGDKKSAEESWEQNLMCWDGDLTQFTTGDDSFTLSHSYGEVIWVPSLGVLRLTYVKPTESLVRWDNLDILKIRVELTETLEGL